MTEVAASILAADLTALRAELASVETADRIHFDVMDGHFVPNFSLGFSLLEDLTRCTDRPIDVHLMIECPARYLDRITEFDVASVTVHAEATEDVPAVADRLREAGITPGVALNPDTDCEAIEAAAAATDRITVMGVTPGFSGQSFNPATITRIDRLNDAFSNRIEVDGGIDLETAPACVKAGADVLVSGSTVFASDDRTGTVESLQSL